MIKPASRKTHHAQVSRLILCLLPSVLLMSCASNPPRDLNNLCAIFQEKTAWHQAALEMEGNRSVPLHVPMAIMYHESRFIADAKAQRNYTFFGLIPWGRKSSAYGYPQALDGTWRHYIKDTGNRGADRDDFSDAIDFIGWYIEKSHRYNGVAKNDAFHQYLNYHEGWQGYKNQSWKRKKRLREIAAGVSKQSLRYAEQYRSCKDNLSPGFWYRVFH